MLLSSSSTWVVLCSNLGWVCLILWFNAVRLWDETDTSSLKPNSLQAMSTNKQREYILCTMRCWCNVKNLEVSAKDKDFCIYRDYNIKRNNVNKIWGEFCHCKYNVLWEYIAGKHNIDLGPRGGFPKATARRTTGVRATEDADEDPGCRDIPEVEIVLADSSSLDTVFRNCIWPELKAAYYGGKGGQQRSWTTQGRKSPDGQKPRKPH